MKVQVRFDKCVGIPPRRIHYRDRFAHRNQVLFVCSRGRERSDFRLQNLANFDEVARSFRLPNLDHTVEGLADGIGSSIGDKRTPAGIRFDQALFSQGLDGFANGGAAHSKLLSQLAFGRKLVARFERALDDRVFDLLNDLLVKARRAYDFVHGSLDKRPVLDWIRRSFSQNKGSWSSCWTTLPHQPKLPQPPHFPSSIHTVLMLVNSRIPCTPSSRPCPDHFTPPNGIRGSEATMRLMNTIPDSKSSIKRGRSRGSSVHALAPKPKRLSLAMRMASSTSLARNTLATGPNNSSLYAGESSGMSVSTVGA